MYSVNLKLDGHMIVPILPGFKRHNLVTNETFNSDQMSQYSRIFDLIDLTNSANYEAISHYITS